MKKALSFLLAVILAFGGVAGLMLALPDAASAATTLTANTDSDTGYDASTNTTLALDAADGAGLSLREALHWAADGDNVTFELGLSGQTITLSGTQLTIDKDIFLDGDIDDDGSPDITISGNGTSRVIYATGPFIQATDARLEGLIITGGNTTSQGGGIYNDSCVLTIINCTFTGNSANNNGGGVYNPQFSLSTITNCTFSGNTATSGGGMANGDSSPTITNCTFSGNSASSGGGMYNQFSVSATITNCTLMGSLP